MLGIKKRRKKSIKSRLMIDFGVILIGACIFNFCLVTYIYQSMLNKKSNDNTDIISNATITQAKLILQRSSKMMDSLSQNEVLLDNQLSNQKKIQKLENYTDTFFAIGLIDLEGNGITRDGSEFQVDDHNLFKQALKNRNFKDFDIIEYKNKLYLVFVQGITNASHELENGLVGVQEVEYMFKQIIDVSSGETCFIAHPDGRVILAVNGKYSIEDLILFEDVQEIGTLFEEDLLINKLYKAEIKDPYSDYKKKVKLRYGVINEAGWVVGVSENSKELSTETHNFNISMLIVMIIVILIGVIGVYITANSVTKRILSIANHLGESRKNEFSSSIPRELLEAEDELGIIAKEMNLLESEMTDMLASIKESIDYLNNKVIEIEVSNQEISRDSN